MGFNGDYISNNFIYNIIFKITNYMELQKNYITGESYQGKNQGILLAVKEGEGFKSNYWLTFLQAKGKGLSIKKGSKGVSVFKGFSRYERKTKDKKGEDKIITYSSPNGFARVFNLDCTEDTEQKITKLYKEGEIKKEKHDFLMEQLATARHQRKEVEKFYETINKGNNKKTS